MIDSGLKNFVNDAVPRYQQYTQMGLQYAVSIAIRSRHGDISRAVGPSREEGTCLPRYIRPWMRILNREAYVLMHICLGRLGWVCWALAHLVPMTPKRYWPGTGTDHIKQPKYVDPQDTSCEYVEFEPGLRLCWWVLR